jgi:hypothetical protein
MNFMAEDDIASLIGFEDDIDNICGKYRTTDR